VACYVKFIEKGGREFKLGRFNEGKKSDTEIALTAARKYKNLFRNLECGGHLLVVERMGGSTQVPTEMFFGKL